MARIWTPLAASVNLGAAQIDSCARRYRGGLRLAHPGAGLTRRGPDKYCVLDLRRRRAQIRARRALQLVNS